MQPRANEAAPEPSSRTKTAFTLALAVAALFVAYFVQRVLFITVTGVLVAIVLDAMAGLGMRWLKLGRKTAVIVAAALSLGALVGTVALMAVPVVKQGSAFVEDLPKKTESWKKRLDELGQKYPLLAEANPMADHPKSGTSAKETVKGAANAASSVLEGLIAFVSLFFIAVFFALEPERYTEGLARLLPGRPYEERLELLHRLGAALRNYLVALGIYIVAMAALWSFGLWLIGIDYFLLFGVLGGLVEIVPYVGPLVGLAPPLFVAVGMGGSKVALVLGLYGILHVVEGYLLVPLLMEKREHLPPPITLISILGFGAAFGFWGVLLAVPLATIAYVWVTHSLLQPGPAELEEGGAVTVEQPPFRPGLAGGI